RLVAAAIQLNSHSCNFGCGARRTVHAYGGCAGVNDAIHTGSPGIVRIEAFSLGGYPYGSSDNNCIASNASQVIYSAPFPLLLATTSARRRSTSCSPSGHRVV